MKMNRKARRAAQFGAGKGSPGIGVRKGFGPRHSENAQAGLPGNQPGAGLAALAALLGSQGGPPGAGMAPPPAGMPPQGFDPSQLQQPPLGAAKGTTDVVPAMLTPREAVLNRNAAELAGRGNIEKLNKSGNALASNGVDLAGSQSPGMAIFQGAKQMRTKTPSSKQKPQVPGYQAGGSVNPAPGGAYGLGARDQYGRQFSARNAFGGYGAGAGAAPGVLGAPGVIGGPGGPFPGREPGGVYPGILGGAPDQGNVGAYPAVLGQPGGNASGAFPGRGPGGVYPGLASGSFYPPNSKLNPMGLAGGSGDVNPQGIGSPQPGAQFPQVQLSAPNIMAMLQQEGKKQGLSPTQIAGLAKAFTQSDPNAGGNFGPTTDVSGGYYGLSGSTGGYLGGYQGGISDIGYPPGISPDAVYHADKGSNWVGPYNPANMILRYWGGTSSVPNFFR